jgi:hypothetical protein
MATGMGVLVAYGLCVALFGCFRLHAEWSREETVRVTAAQVAES